MASHINSSQKEVFQKFHESVIEFLTPIGWVSPEMEKLSEEAFVDWLEFWLVLFEFHVLEKEVESFLSGMFIIAEGGDNTLGLEEFPDLCDGGVGVVVLEIFREDFEEWALIRSASILGAVGIF